MRRSSSRFEERQMRRLPSPINLEAMKREARDLLHALRRRDAAALRRYYGVDSLAGMSPPGLADARYVIAREYGYSSWQNLQRYSVDVARKGALGSEQHDYRSSECEAANPSAPRIP